MIACGLPPTAIVTDLSVIGLMRVTVPSPLFATHTDPAPKATPAGDCPTWIVALTDCLSGSIRTTASSSESTTHTPSPPTAIPVGASPTPIGVGSPLESTRTTLLASVSVSHVAPSPIAIPAGLAFGSSCPATVVPSRRVSSPVDGATQTELPCVAIATAPVGSTLPIRVTVPNLLNTGSTRPTRTLLVPGLSTTHKPPGPAAIPVGGPGTRTRPSLRGPPGSMREIVWSSRLATHSDPEPNAIAPGRSPTGIAATTRSLRVSIAATSLGATLTVLAPELASFTATAPIAASSSAPATAIRTAPRCRLRGDSCGVGVRLAGRSSPGSWARIARSSS